MSYYVILNLKQKYTNQMVEILKKSTITSNKIFNLEHYNYNNIAPGTLEIGNFFNHVYFLS